MSIFYGIKGNLKDVTDICLEKLSYENVITIPSGDYSRAFFFSDHIYGTEKKVFVVINGSEYEYDQYQTVSIDLLQSTVSAVQYPTREDIPIRLNEIHSRLKITGGSLQDEMPEQKMVLRYFTGNEKVLELGGNIGRNSLVIASLVDPSTFVSLESNRGIAKQLQDNRDLNQMTFHIEPVALSKRKLLQKDWDTILAENAPPSLEGYFEVDTITVEDLRRKYNIAFDTLVIDCEGAFYYILMDMPEILEGITLIVMENDYHDIAHKYYIDSVLKQNGFYADYTESGGWGCCFFQFFQVWKKRS